MPAFPLLCSAGKSLLLLLSFGDRHSNKVVTKRAYLKPRTLPHHSSAAFSVIVSKRQFWSSLSDQASWGARGGGEGVDSQKHAFNPKRVRARENNPELQPTPRLHLIVIRVQFGSSKIRNRECFALAPAPELRVTGLRGRRPRKQSRPV
ncbi:hypothetical protein B0H16DRAFT_1775603 [Mycena metata]|uniref:Secreted protein n=1 Tax=Mycena metata TaxID=1033252 RepID=A0AAD7HWA6_9AGAR|nr:hypothetical protein B0H16DRAFT_1775603 [Mycena metata]